MRNKLQIEGISETTKLETSGTESFKIMAKVKMPVENNTNLREKIQFEREVIGIKLFM